MIEVASDSKFYSAGDMVPEWQLVLWQLVDFMNGRPGAISQAALRAFHVGFSGDQQMLVEQGKYALFRHISLSKRHLWIDKHLEDIAHNANTIDMPCLRLVKRKPEIRQILAGPDTEIWGP